MTLADDVPPVDLDLAASRRSAAFRRWLAPVAFAVFGLVDILVLGLNSHQGDATFAFSQPFAKVTVPNLSLPGRDHLLRLRRHHPRDRRGAGLRAVRQGLRRVAITVVVFLFVLALLCWADAGQTTAFNVVNLLQGTLAGSIPIMLGALTGVICSRSGVINVGIEGQLLLGAFTAAIVASGTGSLWLGLVSGALAGSLVGVLLAVFAIGYRVDQVVLGVVLNTLILGLTGYLLRRPHGALRQHAELAGHVLGDQDPAARRHPDRRPGLLRLHHLPVPDLHRAGRASRSACSRTRWGLRTRAIGEHPVAADTVGINVIAMRYRNVIAAGLIAGIGGAYFTIGSVGSFGKDMTSGEGYIALAAMIFGRYTPFGAISAALLFGFTTQLQSIMSTLNMPDPVEPAAMTPYIVTIIVLAGLVGKVRGPRAEGIPYIKA